MTDRIYFQYDRETLYQRARECGYKCIQDYLEALVNQDLHHQAEFVPEVQPEIPEEDRRFTRYWQANPRR